MTNCLVELAMKYGDQDEDGQGYWLVVYLKNGRMFRGPAYKPQNGIVRMRPFNSDDTEPLEDKPVMFIRCDEVVAATVEF